ncbi:heterokaryon incompatibility protein-domain-containing protein [Xylaria sp. FL0043]|nr:heterokaryon incompatibility protein-domain-containing protein [Xylaria sp. FL0043]
MWLLHTCSWEMNEFISYKQAPPYAVLSHTWGNEEVLFRDWQYASCESVEKKEGFNKIKNCCEQAAAEGLEWVWIDTCCINKDSSAELTEAINSMFQWYKSAAVCYVYLCDISDDIESNIAKSRWITRGWTLQELIAPREVVFYSCNWEALGTRSNLSACLAIATNINEPFLVGRRDLNEASIAQRMSWAARRTTSREEDEAYCLLGIFNVNMPLIYGEGLKAFRRLQEVLAREYPKDHSLFAWGKIVKRLSNEVDEHQAYGLKPIDIQHNPDEVGKEGLGLFAKRPRDFQHSGQIVCVPNAKHYFRPGLNTILVLAGDAVHVSLPLVRGVVIAKHLKRPPIVYHTLMRTTGRLA